MIKFFVSWTVHGCPEKWQENVNKVCSTIFNIWLLFPLCSANIVPIPVRFVKFKLRHLKIEYGIWCTCDMKYDWFFLGNSVHWTANIDTKYLYPCATRVWRNLPKIFEWIFSKIRRQWIRNKFICLLKTHYALLQSFIEHWTRQEKKHARKQ